MVNFIKVKNKYSNDIYWININKIQCIRQSGNCSVIILDLHNNTNIIVDEKPDYIFALMHGEIPRKSFNI